MLVKILGIVDLAAAFAFLILTFGYEVSAIYLMFCAVLLGIKGLFAFKGDVLSFVDLFAGFFLFLAIFLNLFSFILWIFTFLLLAKGFVSFL